MQEGARLIHVLGLSEMMMTLGKDTFEGGKCQVCQTSLLLRAFIRVENNNANIDRDLDEYSNFCSL